MVSPRYSEMSTTPRNGRILYLLAISTCVGIGTLLKGYDEVTVTIAGGRRKFAERIFSLLTDRFQTAFTILSAGAFLGSAVSGWTSDKFSRKWSMMLGCFIFIIGSIIQTTSRSKDQFLASRFFDGLGIGILSLVVPLYCSEISPPNIRGLIVGIPIFMRYFGSFLGYWISYGCRVYDDQRQWRIPMGLQILWAGILLCAIPFLPHSPRWLLLKQREREAHDVVRKLLKTPDTTEEQVDAVFKEMRDGIYGETAKGCWPVDLWSTPEMRKRSLIALAVFTFTSWSGVHVLIAFLPRAIAAVEDGLNVAELISRLYMGVPVATILIFVALVVDTLGRKVPLMFSNASLVCLWSILAALMATYYESFPSTFAAEDVVTLVVIFLIAIIFSMSYDPISSILASEIFPTHTRSIGMATAVSLYWAWAILHSEVTIIALADIYWRYLFVFLAVNLVAFFIVLFFFPETKGRTLENISTNLYAKRPHDLETTQSNSNLMEGGHPTK